MNPKQILDFYPLSPLQQGLLFHTLHAPETEVYVEQLSCTLSGKLNVDAFERAWQQMFARHAILRTSFISSGVKEPVQVVHRQVQVPLERYNWCDLTEAERQARLTEFEQTECARGFKLSEPPLLRLALIQMTEDECQFVFTHHHLLLDGWSVPILVQEIFAAYEAFDKGRELRLPAPRQFRDYIVWLKKQDLSQAENYWRKKLAGFTFPTPLGVAENPESKPHYRFQQARLSTATMESLDTLARQQRVTLNTIVQGAWALLLSRYSGEDDVVYGTTVSGRPPDLAGAESTVGLFINTLPVRVQMRPDVSVAEWLRELQVQQVELRQYEYSSLVDIQGWSDVPRGLPLFESLLVFENYPVESAAQQAGEAGTVMMRDVRFVEKTNFPLTLVAMPGEGLTLKIGHDGTRYDAATVDRMLGHLDALLAGMATAPQQRLSDVPILTEAERQQILVEWNQTAVDYPADKCVHQLFAEQVARTPNAIAVLHQNEQLTYRELDDKSNQLAHSPRQLGVGPDALVGICVERSTAMIVGLLGILKAGGAYLPLDPSYPQERLDFMLRDASVSVLLTQEHLAQQFPHEGLVTICLDKDWQRIAAESTQPPLNQAQAENLAYVIYTSGSTGQPKGTMIPHRAINRLVCNTAYVRFEASDIIAQVSNASFDAATFEIWGALLNGARLVVMEKDVVLSPHEFAAQLRAQGITTMFLTAALFNQIVGAVPDAFRGLRNLLAGGEALDARWVREALRQHPPQRLLNGYGPTETTTFAVCHLISEVKESDRSIPIGRPIENTQLYILDKHLHPVPVGVTGELYIGGPGVGRGYLNRPELTAEKFIAWQPEVGSQESEAKTTAVRLYRTGDLVRYRSDGVVDFLGRIDGQVKLRGLRIELGEIEAVLTQHPQIREAVAVARESDGGKQLLAYIVPEEEAALNIGELRNFLQTKLPDYMIPALFVTLPKLPLTPNGKVDRRALPAPDGERPELENAYVAPRTPTEELLCGIWSSVLNVERVGINDDFFALGGHSLRATQLVSRVREVFGVEVPLRTLFEQPTINALSRQIEAGHNALLTPPIQPTQRDGELPLSFGQQRMWYLNQLEPDNPFYNIFSAVRLTGELNLVALEQSLQELVRRHESLRTTFVMKPDGQLTQVIAPQLTLPLVVMDLRDVSANEREQEARRVANAEALGTFDLAHGPLLRVKVLQLDEQEHVLLLTMHHIISDGWSMGVFIREATLAYDAFSNQRIPQLPDLRLQYADYAHWQREWLSGEVLEQQLAYWKEQLQGRPDLLDLPTDHPRSAEPSWSGAAESFTLPPALQAQLKAFSRQQGATLFMTLLAAFQTLLHRYSRQDGISIGTPIANRTRGEIEDVIGFFINTLVLHADFSSDPNFIELLRQVRETTLGAYGHQDLPFEQLVEALQPERKVGHSPLFQVMFTLQNVPTRFPDVPEAKLKLSEFISENDTARFDLTLVMTEGNEALSGQLWYNTDLFEAATIKRMVGHFITLLEGILAEPKQRVGALPIMPEAERQLVVTEWNQTECEFPREQCAHQLFEAQVERTPEAIAVIFGGATLSYRELNARANQLAHYLLKKGVQAETLVGLCMERSLEMIVGLLGVLKAGAAYVPLDPDYPADRVSFMLNDTQAPVLLTQSHLVPGLPASQCEIIQLDKDCAAIAQEGQTEPATEVRATNLAYVIYTSGSTGKPKGVMLEHRGLCNFALAYARATGITTESRVLQFASLNFDASVAEIFSALLSGARLCLARREWLLSAADLIRLLNEEAITNTLLPPSLLKVLPVEEVKGLPTLISGGESCTKELATRWSQNRRFFNAYGPTETTVAPTWYEVTDVAALGHTVPIGSPISNMQVYVLDKRLQPVPIGVPGEICVGGVGLARGYLNRPELTAEKFVAVNTANGDSQAKRLYRTGDLARWLPDGKLEYLGRLDEQVKVRGYRIELGEIEAALQSHASIQEAVVIARDEGAGDKRLVAYVIAAPAAEIDVPELKEHLRRSLPEYMTPSAFMLLETLPLTPNGKVDRNALPAPNRGEQLTDDYVMPRNQVEKILAQIWAEVLGLERVGIRDNFFEVGGDSMLSIQVMARANQTGLQVKLKDFLQHPTIEGLGRALDTSEAVEVEQGIVIGDAPLTPIQHWFFEQPVTDRHQWNMSTLLEIERPLNPAWLAQGVKELLRHHDALRLRFVQVAGKWHQYNAPVTEAVPFTVVDLSDLPTDAQQSDVEAYAANLQQSLSLSEGPLLRVAYFDLGRDRSHRLLVICHHLLMDEMSFNLLLDDFLTTYRQQSQGVGIQLPPKTTSFVTWARRLQQYAQSPSLLAEMDYWLHPINSQIAPLPVDYPGGVVTEATKVRIITSLSADETSILLRAAATISGARVNEIVLFALVRVLARWTGSRYVLVEMVGHGREELWPEVDLSRTIGWFSTIFPVLFDVGESDNPVDTLRSITAQIRAIPQRGISFGLLRYLSDNPEIRQQLSAIPRAEVNYNFLGQYTHQKEGDTAIRPTQEARGMEHNLLNEFSFKLHVGGSLAGGELGIFWSYGQNIHRQTTIEHLGEDCLQELRQLIAIFGATTAPKTRLPG